MDCKNYIVETSGGFICRFEEDKSNGDWIVVCFDGTSSFHRKVLVRNSVGTLKIGEKLSFSYYGSNGVFSFTSSTEISSIQPVLTRGNLN